MQGARVQLKQQRAMMQRTGSPAVTRRFQERAEAIVLVATTSSCGEAHDGLDAAARMRKEPRRLDEGKRPVGMNTARAIGKEPHGLPRAGESPRRRLRAPRSDRCRAGADSSERCSSSGERCRWGVGGASALGLPSGRDMPFGPSDSRAAKAERGMAGRLEDDVGRAGDRRPGGTPRCPPRRRTADPIASTNAPSASLRAGSPRVDEGLEAAGHGGPSPRAARPGPAPRIERAPTETDPIGALPLNLRIWAIVFATIVRRSTRTPTSREASGIGPGSPGRSRPFARPETPSAPTMPTFPEPARRAEGPGDLRDMDGSPRPRTAAAPRARPAALGGGARPRCRPPPPRRAPRDPGGSGRHRAAGRHRGTRRSRGSVPQMPTSRTRNKT